MSTSQSSLDSCTTENTDDQYSINFLFSEVHYLEEKLPCKTTLHIRHGRKNHLKFSCLIWSIIESSISHISKLSLSLLFSPWVVQNGTQSQPGTVRGKMVWPTLFTKDCWVDTLWLRKGAAVDCFTFHCRENPDLRCWHLIHLSHAVTQF